MELPQPGDEFESAYQLHEVLGAGGFAVVFRATELGMAKREVAVKVLKPGRDGRYEGDIPARFRREVQMLSRLQDPHSVMLYRFGQTDEGLLFLVFEYVPGRDLDELLASVGRFDPGQTIHVLRQLLLALREAHLAGLLHRDIKPRNIRVFEYIDDPLRVKLLDFGIAKPTFGGQHTQITQTGEMLGTPRYMSPEQLTESELGPASDIYSLGVVAFEMLTGGLQHGTRWSDQLDRVHSGHVFSVPQLAQAGHGLNAVVGWMTTPDDSRRYRTAAEVLRALDAVEAGRAPPPPGQRSPAATSDTAAPTAPEIVYATPPTDRRNEFGIVLFFGTIVLMGGVIAYLLATGAGAEGRSRSDDTRERATGLVKRSSEPARRAVVPPPDASSPPTRDEIPSASPGCGSPAPFVGTGALDSGHLLNARRWTVHVPERYDPNEPHAVVLLFHQDLMTGADIIEQTEFDRAADQHGFVVIAPHDQGTLGTGTLTWRAEGSEAIAPALLLLTAEQLCLDPERIFAAGHGVGGYAVERLSCKPWLAGIATNSFRREQAKTLCTDDPSIPFLHLAPVKSDRIPVDGGPGCHGATFKPSLDDFESRWRERNGCAERRSERWRHDEHVCFEWHDCAAPFVSCHLQGGHSWPDSKTPELSLPRKGCSDGEIVDFPATETIWTFFDSLEPRSNEAAPPW